MAINEDYILAMSQGLAYVATKNTAAPATIATAPAAGWTDLGAISTEGLTEDLSHSRTEFKRWGSISVFRAVITDQKHAFKVKFLETNPSVLGVFYRTATPVGTAGLYSVTDDTTGVIQPRAFLFDILDGANKVRFWVPEGEVTAVDSPVYKTDGLVEYGVTITAYPNTSGVAVSRQFQLAAG